MSKRRRGFPSETGVKRGRRNARGGEKELLERLGNNDPCPCGFRTPLSSAAAVTAVAFDGSGRADYSRER
jgi:hypothetical protein